LIRFTAGTPTNGTIGKPATNRNPEPKGRELLVTLCHSLAGRNSERGTDPILAITHCWQVARSSKTPLAPCRRPSQTLT